MNKLIIFLSLFLFGCSNDNLITSNIEEGSLPRTTEQPTINPGNLPDPFIVGGEEVDPPCPD